MRRKLEAGLPPRASLCRSPTRLAGGWVSRSAFLQRCKGLVDTKLVILYRKPHVVWNAQKARGWSPAAGEPVHVSHAAGWWVGVAKCLSVTLQRRRRIETSHSLTHTTLFGMRRKLAAGLPPRASLGWMVGGCREVLFSNATKASSNGN